jgi:hypothetical protein
MHRRSGRSKQPAAVAAWLAACLPACLLEGRQASDREGRDSKRVSE